MGLVIQNTAEPLLPLTEAPAGEDAANGGVFASLLASLAAVVESEASPLSLDPSTLPVPGEDKDDLDDTANAELLAALFPMTAPLTLVPQPLVKVVSAPVSEPANAIAALEAPLAQAASQGVEPPTEPSPTEAGVAPMPLDSKATAAPDAPTLAPGAASPGEAAITTTTTQPSPPAPALSAVLSTPESRESGSERPERIRPLDGPPPIEAATDAATEATSVVRPVGNAESETNNAGDAGQGAAHGRKEGVERPQPRASSSGIEHAAANSAVGQLREAQPASPTEPVAPTAEPPQAAPEIPPQVEQVATTVIETVEAGGGEARIHLDPVDLGEVTIHIRADGDSVRLEVRAERHEAAQLLRDHSQDLSRLLGERGLNLSDVNVGLGRGSNQGAWGQDNRAGNRPNSGEFASIFGGEDSVPLDIHNRLRAAYNPDGAHMYRV